MNQLDNLFKQQYNNTKKLISFNPRWTTEAGGVRGMVVDQENRLMLEPGDSCITVDKKGQRYMILGTPFGIFVLYQRELFGKSLYWYETTRALIRVFPVLAKDCESPTGILDDFGLEFVLSGSLLLDSQLEAERMAMPKGKVCDGIPLRKIRSGKRHVTPEQKVVQNAKDKQKTKEKKAQRAPVKLVGNGTSGNKPKRDYRPKVTRSTVKKLTEVVPAALQKIHEEIAQIQQIEREPYIQVLDPA